MKVLRIQGLAILTVFISAVCASAQNNSAKTITNADMEKYRQERVKADDEYRRTYAEKGLPSPEELEKREEERQQRLFILSDQLAGERRIREYAEQMAAAANNDQQIIYVAQDDNGGYYPYYPIVGGGGFGKTRFRNLSNVEMIRDQANINRSMHGLPNFRNNNSRRGGFRGTFRSGGARPVFSPRR
ncbi:MAG TPA: hypothetical protein VGO50_03130 [Pyrinomonadaceae bacterium]|jgi:hypothetical protein|nr:hypothetical protein [Pyrinomonadaceae bacterium]